MRRWWAWWVEAWDRREPATALALVRILVGACVLGDLLYLRSLGLAEALASPPPDGLGYGAAAQPWSIRWFGASSQTAELVWWLTAIGAAALLIGLGTRLAAVAMALGSAQLAALWPDGDRGIDAVMRGVALVLALSSCHARWSIDAMIWRRLGRPFPDRVPGWPRRLLLLQVLWIYFSSGHNKVSPEWWPHGGYSALANALSDPHFARWSASWVPAAYPVPQLAALLTMIFELGAPLVLVCLWFETTADRPGRVRRWCNRWHVRWLWIGVGVVMHLGIAVLLKLGMFPWGMLALYPVLLRPDELVALEARLRRAS